MAETQAIRNLTPLALANLLANAGSKVATEESVMELVRLGAPVNDDGTIDIIRFVAWMERRRNGGL